MEETCMSQTFRYGIDKSYHPVTERQTTKWLSFPPSTEASPYYSKTSDNWVDGFHFVCGDIYWCILVMQTWFLADLGKVTMPNHDEVFCARLWCRGAIYKGYSIKAGNPCIRTNKWFELKKLNEMSLTKSHRLAGIFHVDKALLLFLTGLGKWNFPKK